MKTPCFIFALFVVLSCVSFSHASKLRTLLNNGPAVATASASSSCVVYNGHCIATAKVSTKAINDAAKSIAAAFSKAVAAVKGGGDVKAEAHAFALAIARAYAVIISEHVLSVKIYGIGYACAYTKSQAAAFATAIAEATAEAFAQSTNDYAKATATCLSSAIAIAKVKVEQNVFFATCVKNYGYDAIYEKVVDVGFAEAIADATAYVFTQIKDKIPAAKVVCLSQASSSG